MTTTTTTTTTSTAIYNDNEPPRVADLVHRPKQGQTTLHLVRHGQTEGNARHLFIGSTDLPLDPLGERQARQVGSRFSGIEIDTLISSPMQRARQTAAEISLTTGKPVEVVQGLSEIDFGALEGYTIEQVLDQFPAMRSKLSAIENIDLEWPEGESRFTFYDRVLTTFLGILERHAGTTVTVVCHGGVIGALIAMVEGGSPSDYATYGFQNCSITTLVVTQDQILVRLRNDYSHLDEVQTEPLRLSPTFATEKEQR